MPISFNNANASADDDDRFWKDEKSIPTKYILLKKKNQNDYTSIRSFYVLVPPTSPPPSIYPFYPILFPLAFFSDIFPLLEQFLTLSVHCYLRHYYYISDLKPFSIPTSLTLGQLLYTTQCWFIFNK
jgi:hypothetical protein